MARELSNELDISLNTMEKVVILEFCKVCARQVLGMLTHKQF